ncbi:MAG: lipoyl synthase [Opitutales bacterium]
MTQLADTTETKPAHDTRRKPPWLRAKLPSSPAYKETLGLVQGKQLHTVCQSAQCPNMGECWSRGTATLMILGNVCTRACTFCNIITGRPTELDLGEPARVAEAVAQMSLKHAVITSVARDDLKDGGASVWAATIRAIRHRNPGTAIEVLIPDFQGKAAQLDTVLDAMPDILNHNMETVERLQRPIRKTARYERTLWVLDHAKRRDFITKSGLMLGIGEEKDEVAQTLRDLRAVDVDILTLGQYLQPTPKHAPIDRWVTPEEFAEWKAYALEIGFKVCESGPLVRSSYHAEEASDQFDLVKRRLGGTAS